MLIYFVRHGQTDWNIAFKWQGRSDIALNLTGQAQAQAIQSFFVQQDLVPSAVISSPLQRAMATAEVIAKPFNIKVVAEPAFLELKLGAFEGKSSDELKAQHGDTFEDWLAAYHTVASPEGEDIKMGIARMHQTLLNTIEQHGDRLVIVAHQAILMAMKSALSGDQSIEMLQQYKQANFEVDTWDVEQACIFERININQI
ncbi:MAG: histidine phosphatase family protein [Arenicellales bacterium]